MVRYPQHKFMLICNHNTSSYIDQQDKQRCVLCGEKIPEHHPLFVKTEEKRGKFWKWLS